MLTEKQQKRNAKQFSEYWINKGNEKSETQMFWISLLKDVFGIEHPEQYLKFEDKVINIKSNQFEDVWIPKTKVLIEQKSSSKSLDEPIRQSNGTYKTAFEQACDYANTVEYDRHPRWIITCNFKEFRIHDMNKNAKERSKPEAIILLKDLEKEYYRLSFIVDVNAALLQEEIEVSIKAGEIVGILYNELIKQYNNPNNSHSQHSLNALCVRLVFCLYAEDAGLFGKKDAFYNYLVQYKNNANIFRKALIDLFEVLDKEEEFRDPYDIELNNFPYVNGGLFNDKNIEIPQFNDQIINIILNKASLEFDWSSISPTIFGAVFESTLNPETRKSGGMHYTSIENIHKVIDPLFLDELKVELQNIKSMKQVNKQIDAIDKFQDKISSLIFLDPAAGSGNFLTETYLSLRKLENEAIALKQKNGQQILGFDGQLSPIKVSIKQFYGIEINDFAVTVAKTALWIAESQMMKETEDIIHMDLNFLPLKSYANIVEGNALDLNWNDVIDKRDLNYIIGNPPFVANTSRTSSKQFHSRAMLKAEQKDDRIKLFGKSGGVLDYVACWYKKSSDYMQGTNIAAAFVSTDSIMQGQQVAPLWKPLLNSGININFAYKSFKWSNETKNNATVYVIIIGFSYVKKNECVLYLQNNTKRIINHLNPYLLDAPDVVIESRNKPLCDVPEMKSGGKPVDGGYLIFTDEEKQDFIKKEPSSIKYFHRFTSGENYIKNKMGWCLWLVNASPHDIQKMPLVKQRINKVRDFRLKSKKEATRKCAETPSIFMEVKQPESDYVIMPLTTSRNRKYIPIGYLTKDIIVNNAASFIPDATLYHFGVLISIVHMAWMRAICGYYGPSYRYSNKIVYNNFIWPDISEKMKLKIESTAKSILDARKLYPDSSLMELYDPLLMPIELKKAHEANDKAVLKAYGFKTNTNEEDIVTELLKMYQNMLSE